MTGDKLTADEIRNTVLAWAHVEMVRQGVAYENWEAMKAFLKENLKERRRRGLLTSGRISHYHQLVDGLEDCADHKFSSALRAKAFGNKFAAVVEQVKRNPNFHLAQAQRLESLNATAIDVDESRQTKATEDRSDTGDGRSCLGASKAPAAFAPNSTSLHAAPSTPAAHTVPSTPEPHAVPPTPTAQGQVAASGELTAFFASMQLQQKFFDMQQTVSSLCMFDHLLPLCSSSHC